MPGRPRSIILFEGAFLLTMGIGFLASYLSWDQMIAQTDAMPEYEGRGLAFMIWSLVFWTPVNLLLLFLTAHRRSIAGKWIITGLAIFNVFDFLTLLFIAKGGLVEFSEMDAVLYVSSFVALWFLFRPDAKRWFDERSNLPGIFS